MYFQNTFFAIAQLVTTFIFFSAWDRSRVKWDNSRNSTQNMRTYVSCKYRGKGMHKKIIKCIVLTSKSRSKSRNVLCSIDFCVLPKVYVCMAKRESSNYWLSSKLASWASEQFCYSTLFESTMSSKIISRWI